ncbi:MAG: hypothetical protein U1D30_09450 [Planctomycetota bacterium]
MDARFDVAGNKIQFGFRLILDILWQVNSVDEDGTAEISQTVNRIQVLMSSPNGGELRYDSKQESPRKTLMGASRTPAGRDAGRDLHFKSFGKWNGGGGHLAQKTWRMS